VRKLLKPVLEILAGIPSVVLGFFALTFISPELVQRINPGATQFNIAAAGIGVRRPAPVPDHPRPQRGRRTLRPAGAPAY
jgi:ABC-type phosphate transport system permease subunit